MQQSKKTVSIKDVAAYVGLSVGTVSMALNNSEKIAEKTKVIVKKAAEELKYPHHVGVVQSICSIIIYTIIRYGRMYRSRSYKQLLW